MIPDKIVFEKLPFSSKGTSVHYSSPGGSHPDQTYVADDQAGYLPPSYGFAQQQVYNEPNTVSMPGIRRSRLANGSDNEF